MNEIPLGDRIIVKVIESADTKTSGGIILSALSHTRQTGEVVAVGGGLFTQTGDKIPMTLSVGDIVTFTPETGTPMKIEGEEYKLFRESDMFTYIKK